MCRLFCIFDRHRIVFAVLKCAEAGTLETDSAARTNAREPVEVEPGMHQSRKEQGIQRTSKRLLFADRREALMLAREESGIEAGGELGRASVIPSKAP